MHLHHKLAWVLGIGAALTLGISSLPGWISNAWGPASRATFTEDKPASYVTFNSIINDSNYGDERNFVLVKDATNTEAGGFRDVVNVEDDHTYLVRVFVHNNAAANLNLVAEDVRLAAGITPGLTKNGEIEVRVRSSNANPNEIWDEVNLKANKEFQIAYVSGSGRYYTNANGFSTFALGDEIVTDKNGVKLGYDKLDGRIQGCYKYSGIATFKVKVNFVGSPSFTVEKTVRVEGQEDKTYREAVAAKPGETVKYKIEYVNNGEVTQSGVVVKDTLPSGLSYDSASTVIQNASHTGGVGAGTDEILGGGIDIGNYTPVGAGEYSARVYFTAKVPETATCGSVLTNWGIVKTQNGSKEDSADVIVDCATPPLEEVEYCLPGIPVGDERCTPATDYCKPGIPAGDSRCNDTSCDEAGNCPEPPCEETGTCVTEITRTGAGLTIFLVVIVAAAVVYHHYYVQRNKLKKPAHSRKR
jgi:uncharacterized repeat protein (TIGR01451 family)